MADSDTLPVARYSPVSGVYIDRQAKHISISGKLEVYGPEATAARATTVANAINSNWTAKFSDGFRIDCNVSVTYRAPSTKAGPAGQIEVLKMTGPSNWDGSEINLNANGAAAFTWVVAHEFGHMIGLKDRYSESILSVLRGKFGGKRSNTVQKGYAKNMMGVHKGRLEKQNVKDLMGENAPSWLSQDNRVRAWVNSHKLSEIGHISTRNKIRMIKVLMDWWIGKGDLTAIVRIINSVTDKTEAGKIRDAIKLNDFSSLGQRMSVRIALAGLPK